MGKRLVSSFDELERSIGRDVGRNISQLVDATRGQLERAARSISDHPHPKLAIVTGFFVPAATPAAAETDGPIGAVILAAGLEQFGIDVELVTDARCEPALSVARDAMNCRSPVVSVTNASDVVELQSKYLSNDCGLSHIVSIERAGPAASGQVRNFKGRDLTDLTAPLHRLFERERDSRPYVTIGIGDGGNEIGMGSLDTEIVAGNIKNGAEIACVTPCDHLIVSGVSNWGAYALAAGIAHFIPAMREGVLDAMTAENCNSLLKAIVDDGPAVDAILGARQYTIDGLPPEAHDDIVQIVRDWLNSAK